MKIAIIGAGWAGLAAAVQATQAGHQTVIFEAAKAPGGRARAVHGRLPDGTPVTLDNGQHILIGAYLETLRLMRQVGVDTEQALRRLPMSLLFADGRGLRFAPWPAPLDALGAIMTARGWSVSDKWSMLRLALGWQLAGFQCDAASSVGQLCRHLSPRAMAELIEPLCVAALNTPADQASAQVFLRVMKDALFGLRGGSNLLLPLVDLSTLFPDAAARWLSQHGAELRSDQRVHPVLLQGSQWQVAGERFDTVLMATSARAAARALELTAVSAPATTAASLRQWISVAAALQFEAIATVYAWGPQAKLAHPMLALRSQTGNASAGGAPAQFVFDRGQLGGPPGLLAFVVSASQGTREALQAQVLVQARWQLGLSLQAVQTMVEKHATFACTPALQRPQPQIAPGLLACGDYLAGPYPATLEGAARSAVAAVKTATAQAYDANLDPTSPQEPSR